MRRVSARVTRFQRWRIRRAVLDERALREADQLWEAAQPDGAELPAGELPDTGQPDTGQLSPEALGRLAQACHVLGWLRFSRFEALADGARISELARCVDFLAGLAGTPAPIPRPLHKILGPAADPDAQAGLALDLLRAARSATDPPLLDVAILLLSAAVTATPPGHPQGDRRLDHLGLACHQRYRRDRAPEDLALAIEFGEQAVAATADDHPEKARQLSNLGTAYRDRHDSTDEPADLDRAIELGEQSLALTADDDPDRYAFLRNLGGAYRDRYESAEALADVERAIELGEEALALTPHDELAASLYNTGGSYLRRFERTGSRADIDRVIELGERALSAEPADDHARARSLALLDIAHRERFEHTGEITDLERSIEYAERALGLTPEDNRDHAIALDHLGLAYRKRFESTGALGDLSDAIAYGERAVGITSDSDPRKAGRQGNLSIAYQRRHGRLGDPADLDRAIELAESAAAAKAEGHPLRVEALSHLAVAHRTRYQRTGVLADLERAIELGERAVAGSPQDHIGVLITLGQLSVAYRELFERRGELSDLERAIETGERAAAMPEDNPRLAVPLANLGPAYQLRFGRTGSPADLERAIEVGERAVRLTPEDHAGSATCLANLGLGYGLRFGLTGARDDLERAIELGGRALAATSGDDPGAAARVSNLGRAYRSRFTLDGEPIGPEALHALADRAVNAGTASPSDQVEARYVVGSLATGMGEHELAVDLLDGAVRLLPSVPPRESGWADQEHRIGRYAGLVGQAVAAHCALGDATGAVRIAELGRGVLLAAQMDARTDLTELEQSHPELAARFRRLRDQLTTPHGAADDADRIEERRKSWEQHDALVARIRSTPGHGRFLLPPRLSDLRPATAGGAVLLVNAGRQRGDAVIVTATGDPVLVPLPDLTFADVNALADALLEATHDTGRLTGPLKKKRVLPEILAWLWDTVVAATLDALPPALPPADSGPRVWWMPTGLLGLFPLHAAGHPGRPGALDAVVSSYTPTLRTLARTRARLPTTKRRQLTVALEHTPGLHDLPGTAVEAAHLHAVHDGIAPLTDHHATKDRVLAAMSEATWAHFACHATADLAEPSRGGLRLHDDTLTLPEISRLRLEQAELAYLSACSTAHHGARHADESLHLASAFQLAGFRHVIASLWPLDDRVAAVAAHDLYRGLPGGGTADDAATALHHVTRGLREAHPDRPDLWAPLIHSGP
ncbi:tetratricopeptide repeat protein [Saccharopolyspora erythraea NRRL 2338]|nr:tetratricopeptide repeat protein [Saccharopolyspora erythraea NRRL 2338]